MCHDSFLCGTWLNHMWHDAFTCLSHASHTFDSCLMCHDSFLCATWLIHMWATTHFSVSRVVRTSARTTRAPHRWVTLLISMSHVTHVDESCHWRVVCTSVRTTRAPTSRSRVIYIDESRPSCIYIYIDESRLSCRWDMSLMRSLGSRVAQTNESCHSYRWVIWRDVRASVRTTRAPTSMSHVTYIDESNHSYKMSHVLTRSLGSRVTHINESRHSYR